MPRINCKDKVLKGVYFKESDIVGELDPQLSFTEQQRRAQYDKRESDRIAIKKNMFYEKQPEQHKTLKVLFHLLN